MASLGGNYQRNDRIGKIAIAMDPEIRFTSRPINIKELAILSRMAAHPDRQYLIIQLMLSRLETSRAQFLSEPAEHITEHVNQCAALMQTSSLESLFVNAIKNQKGKK